MAEPVRSQPLGESIRCIARKRMEKHTNAYQPDDSVPSNYNAFGTL